MCRRRTVKIALSEPVQTINHNDVYAAVDRVFSDKFVRVKEEEVTQPRCSLSGLPEKSMVRFSRSNDSVGGSLSEPRRPLNCTTSASAVPTLAMTSNRLLQSPSPGASPTVLVADDNDDTRLMFRTLLGTKGYRVIEAVDGEEAIEITIRENPGLLLLDLGLPRLNGLSVIRRLRDDLKLLDVPVVVITGYDKHFDTAVAAGCDDYLLKPVDFDRLEAILDYYVPTKVKSKTT